MIYWGFLCQLLRIQLGHYFQISSQHTFCLVKASSWLTTTAPTNTCLFSVPCGCRYFPRHCQRGFSSAFVFFFPCWTLPCNTMSQTPEWQHLKTDWKKKFWLLVVDLHALQDSLDTYHKVVFHCCVIGCGCWKRSIFLALHPLMFRSAVFFRISLVSSILYMSVS